MGRAEKLKQLREARAAGSSRLVVQDDEPQDIYDEVDEDIYRAKRRDDLLKDDFIIDDNGEGYVDTGADEWDGKEKYYDSSEEENTTSKQKAKKKIVKKAQAAAPINNFFKPSTVTKKKLDANVDDILNDFMGSSKKSNNLFNPLSSSATKSSVSSTPLLNSTNKTNNLFSISKSKPSSMKKPIKKQKVSRNQLDGDDNDDLSFEINETSFENLDSSPTRMKKNVLGSDSSVGTPSVLKTALPTPLKEGTDPITVKDEEQQQADDDDDDSDDEIVFVKRPKFSTTNITRDVNLTASKSMKLDSEPSTSVAPSSDNDVPDSAEKLNKNVVIDEQDSQNKFKMFWMDYTEVDNSLILFGKILTNDGKFVSGMVQIKGFDREIFFLPREYRKTDEGITDEKITANDVYEEIAPLIMDKFGLSTLKTKPEFKKYAFELPGIPKEKEYLKVLLPYQPPKNGRITLPSDLEGETFSHVFGSNSNIFESFVLQRNIMGPCWLEISNGDFNELRNTSHCKIEVSISNPKFVSPIESNGINNNLAPPSLTCCSISIQTMMNLKENKQEIISVSLATFKNLPQDAPIEAGLKPNDLITLTRPIGLSLPPGLKQIADKERLNLRIFNNEKTLLNCLAALIKLADPDVFLGHKLENYSFDVLLHRMFDLKVNTFSYFGRRNRKQWPSNINNNNFNSNFLIKDIFAGRLLCDIANEMGQSLTTKCQSWDLTEMYEVVCKKKHIPLEINFQQPQYQENANSFFTILKENCLNSLITAEIAFGIQILSLSKQLTNLAGNAWSHTLGGTRAGRNEFILLHEFYRNGFIVPDKESRQRKSQNQSNANGSESNESSNNKKSKYQGGLVFEPEKGLHKNYVLVMDFNSLYPSIIQEFNICFTTIDRNPNNIEELPDVPPSEIKQGVLPKLLHTLVTRRREVKKLMKDSSSTPVERAQYDIKQQALKLTANSMYGCLGYVHSRFYAKPLAMLVTNKGREILMDTRQLAESLGLRVVYGDTDSVMIDTGCTNFQEAIRIGEDFKLKVNERYRLLEIDIDNVFKRLLLHAKKKYAALNVVINNKTGEETTQLEVKGLDMKRREYCPLSREISQYVLNKILSDLDPEVALNEIYSYLEEMTTKIKNNEIRPDSFKINTKLSKDPKSYPGGKNMPAVQVAIRLQNQGKMIKAGSVITFVITEGKEGSVAERARALTDLLVKNSELKPDALYYLEKQIFAPVERLVERIEGIDIVRLAKALGLEHKSKMLNSYNKSGSIDNLQPLESTISDDERFKNSKSLEIYCSNCGKCFRFGGVMSSNDYLMSYSGIQCKHCSNKLSTLSVTSQLEEQIRSYIAYYYQGWVYCDDSTCGIETRQVSVYGKRCLNRGCKGVMRYKYNDKELYNQLLYFESIFNVDKNKAQELKRLYEDDDKAKPAEMNKNQVILLTEQNREFLGICNQVVNKYLNDCGRRYVDMGSIFDFMSV